MVLTYNKKKLEQKRIKLENNNKTQTKPKINTGCRANFLDYCQNIYF